MDSFKKSIIVSDDCSESNIILMEMSEETLEEIVKEKRAWFSGSDKEEVVLCTSNKTYLVKEAPSSNTLLILDNVPEKEDARVKTISKGFYELREHKPSYDKLKSIIGKNKYDLIENIFGDDEGSNEHLTTEDLLDIIQTSPGELERELKRLEAFNYNGRWTLLSDSTRDEVLKEILSIIAMEGWSNQNIPLHLLYDKISTDFPKEVVDTVIEYNTKVNKEDPSCVSLIEEKISHLL